MRPIVLAAATLTAAHALAAQPRIRPFLQGGIAHQRAIQHGFQDVAQHGWITGYGVAAGAAIVNRQGMGAEVSFEHSRSGEVRVYDVNLLPTNDFEPRATQTAVSAMARWGLATDRAAVRAGGSIAWQHGSVTLGRDEPRLGLRFGGTVFPMTGPIRAGLDLTVTRYLGSDTGVGWIIAPALRLEL